jgi:hypothetical protein
MGWENAWKVYRWTEWNTVTTSNFQNVGLVGDKWGIRSRLHIDASYPGWLKVKPDMTSVHVSDAQPQYSTAFEIDSTAQNIKRLN